MSVIDQRIINNILLKSGIGGIQAQIWQIQQNNINPMSNALLAIQNQTDSSRPNDVFVVEVLSVRFSSFTTEIQQELERYQSLQMLTFNSCGISSLSYFPSIPSLIRLDLVMNEITGPELVHLQGCRHLQTIMLGGNLIQKTDHLVAFKGMKQLFQINLLSNPIQSQPGYRSKVFSMFPSLTVLDGLDKGGKDAFNATSMVNTTSRVPTGLFDTSRPAPSFSLPPVASGFGGGSIFGSGGGSGLFSSSPVVAPKSKSRKPAVTRAVSPPPAPIKSGKGAKLSKTSKATSSRTMSSRAGLTFPVGRIKRHLKNNDTQNRVTKGAAIYLSGVLQYLAAEVLQISGNIAKREKKARITPKMINQVFTQDEDFVAALKGTVIVPRQY